MPDRISSVDPGYVAGNLSHFPDALDDERSLYRVANDAVTTLRQAAPYNAKVLIVEDGSLLAPHGIVRLGPPGGELVYYGSRTDRVLKELVRGFANTRQDRWPAGAAVTNAVTAEPHNAIKDAILNIQMFVGLKSAPDPASLHGRLRALEARYFAPKPLFRAFPLSGPPPLTVRFQNFSVGPTVRFLWDFGDGSQSVERNPVHTYQEEGNFTVRLNVITTTGGQGVATKLGHITVDAERTPSFFYIIRQDETKPAYSVETAERLVASGEDPDAAPATFVYVDQTDGDITQRYWIFDDGENETVDDPHRHVTTHQYEKAGVYRPSVFVLQATQKYRRIFTSSELEVL